MKNIGDEFWSDWVTQPTSTDGREFRILYKVVGIEQVYEFGNHGKLIDAERLEPVRVDYRLPEFTILS